MTVTALRDWRFGAGLAVRLLLIVAALPLVHAQWFIPFLATANQNLLSPWSGFLAAGGDPLAFPYGWPYLVGYFPLVFLGNWLGGLWGAHVGLGLGVLCFDAALLCLLQHLGGVQHRKKILLLYWLSPVPIYIGYWHGQLDIFPAMLVVACLLAIARHRYLLAGAVLGAAVASKLSMALIAPFVALYFFGRARLRRYGAALVAGCAASIAAFFVPFCFVPAFRQMVLQTPESAKVFSFALPIDASLSVYILPLALLGLLYSAWRIRRLDFEMLWSFAGIIFMAFLLLTPASPGWAMWALPFLVLHTVRARLTALTLYLLFCGSFVALQLLAATGPLLAFGADLTNPLGAALGDAGVKAKSVLFTIVLASGAALALQMYRYSILQTTFRAATKRPLLLGIGGDSGAGKDTLVDALAGVFGCDALVRVSGDDYHIWDRQKPMWRALTHLNPKANDLESFANNVGELMRGQAILAPQYDHSSGRVLKPMRIHPSEVIAVYGLHALWLPALNALYDLKIYLDMDEALRQYFKIARDVTVRGYPRHKVEEAIAGRQADAARFIHPQADAADLVLRLEPRHAASIKGEPDPLAKIPMRLIALARPGEDFQRLARLLAGHCGLQVITHALENGKTQILIEGEATAEDIAVVAKRLVPDIRELLDVTPKWENGLMGAIQLIVLDQLDRACRRRRVSS